jgi:hypothetical protein
MSRVWHQQSRAVQFSKEIQRHGSLNLKELKALQDENRRLKQMCTELMLNHQLAKKIITLSASVPFSHYYNFDIENNFGSGFGTEKISLDNCKSTSCYRWDKLIWLERLHGMQRGPRFDLGILHVDHWKL